MALPFFYINHYDGSAKEILLEEDTSRHIVQVLRMQAGDQLNLTDGKGTLLKASIVEAHKKHSSVGVEAVSRVKGPVKKVAIGISLLKTATRFEWFLEKATELGVTEIIPLLCSRTEKEKFRQERLQGILISAMLQSQQCWLPVLHEPIAYDLIFRQEELKAYDQKWIAHCLKDQKTGLREVANAGVSPFILIGPEGDFTTEEIRLAFDHEFLPVSLGETRLRSETAGVVAAAILCIE